MGNSGANSPARGAVANQLARLPSGYAAKVLAPRPIKGLSDDNLLGFMLPALGARLVLIEDEASLAQIRLRATPRDRTAVRMHALEPGNGPKFTVA